MAKKLLLKRDLNLTEVLKAVADYAINTSRSRKLQNALKTKNNFESHVRMHIQLKDGEWGVTGAIVEVFEDGEEEESGSED